MNQSVQYLFFLQRTPPPATPPYEGLWCACVGVQAAGLIWYSPQVSSQPPQLVSDASLCICILAVSVCTVQLVSGEGLRYASIVQPQTIPRHLWTAGQPVTFFSHLVWTALQATAYFSICMYSTYYSHERMRIARQLQVLWFHRELTACTSTSFIV